MSDRGVDLSSLVAAVRAAGEPTRLRLLALLAEGEHSVKDLTEILGQSQPRVSRHLKLLADAGLVTRNAEGAWAYYGLAEGGPGADLAHWLIERLDPADADRARDRARLEWVRDSPAAAGGRVLRQGRRKLGRAAQPSRSRSRRLRPRSSQPSGTRQIDMLFDLGTGTGRMLELLSGHYRRAIGIDSSREMIAVARAKLAAASIGNAQVRLGDIANLDPAHRPRRSHRASTRCSTISTIPAGCSPRFARCCGQAANC